MLDLIQKLITEHGSSSILRERLELFSDKYEKLEDMNAQLEERNGELKSKLFDAREEVERLSGIVESYNNNQSAKSLSPEAKQIIEYFYEQGDDVSAQEIISVFYADPEPYQFDLSEVNYYIDILGDYGLVRQSRAITNRSPAKYCISKKGRRYVIERLRHNDATTG